MAILGDGPRLGGVRGERGALVKAIVGPSAEPRLLPYAHEARLGSFVVPAGSFRQRTELTPDQRAILSRLDLPEPARITELAPAAAS